ncbi:HGWP repeat containing protein [Spatholobus suberectus]|nr:HGWP repeat containing protein [Spatholobus suberectus]
MPKPKRIKNLLKLVDGNSQRASSSSDTSIHPRLMPANPIQPILTPNDPLQPSFTPNDSVQPNLTPNPPAFARSQVMSSMLIDNEASQIPNQSQTTQPETQNMPDAYLDNAFDTVLKEKIDDYLSQNSEAVSKISPNDIVGVIFGKEHPSCVRDLGLGLCPTIAFKHITTRLGGINSGSSNASASSMGIEEKFVNMEYEIVTMKSQVQTLIAYIATKEGGNIPLELATLFPTSTQHVCL